MLNIEIQGEQKRIPTNHSEIPLAKFSSIWKILRKYEKLTDVDESNVDEAINQEYDMTAELVAELLEISVEDALNIPFDKATQIVDIFNNDMLKSSPEEDMQSCKFEHNGEYYYYPTLELNALTFGEYAEMKQCEQILGKDVANRFDYLPRQMAILCKKKGEKKGEYDVNKREKEFSSITTDKALQFSFFLLKWTTNLQGNIQTYMENPQEFITRFPILSTDMGGLTKFMMSLQTAYLQGTE